MYSTILVSTLIAGSLPPVIEANKASLAAKTRPKPSQESPLMMAFKSRIVKPNEVILDLQPQNPRRNRRLGVNVLSEESAAFSIWRPHQFFKDDFYAAPGTRGIPVPSPIRISYRISVKAPAGENVGFRFLRAPGQWVTPDRGRWVTVAEKSNTRLNPIPHYGLPGGLVPGSVALDAYWYWSVISPIFDARTDGPIIQLKFELLRAELTD